MTRRTRARLAGLEERLGRQETELAELHDCLADICRRAGVPIVVPRTRRLRLVGDGRDGAA